jgi:four helix bundle protein
MTQFSSGYNLEERTANFGIEIIRFSKTVPLTVISRPIISQIVRSGTSIGANYCEANNASSKKDFKNKIFICKKECQETKHWLRMASEIAPDKKEKIRKLWKECQELTLIFQKIINSLK